MSPCHFFPPAAGVLRTAADASTPRGSAWCADLRGVILLLLKAHCFQELYVLRHERSLQLHEMLVCRALQATCYCDCSLCGLQLQHIAAGTESFSGDWKKPILRFSFCNGLHIPFVKHLCNVTVHRVSRVCSCHRLKLNPLGEPCCSFGEHQRPWKIVIWGIKSRKIFWPAGAGLTP